MGRLMGRNEGCFSYQLGHKNGQIVRWKDFGSGSWGSQPPLFAAPRPKPSVGTPAGRVQDQDQDQEDEQEIVRSPSQPILVIILICSFLSFYVVYMLFSWASKPNKSEINPLTRRCYWPRSSACCWPLPWPPPCPRSGLAPWPRDSSAPRCVACLDHRWP